MAEAGDMESLRSAAKDYAHRVTEVLGDKIDSIVLYGSVARDEAGPDSDIDVLVVSSDSKSVSRILSKISAEQAYETGSVFLLSDVFLDRDDLIEMQRVGSPFVRNLVADGIVLYDNGTFQGIRNQTAIGC